MTAVQEEYSVAPRPIERLEIPKAAARRNFSRKLQTQFGLKVTYADALARAVVDPERARHQLDFVQVRRISGGVATTLHTEVFTPAISVSPVNPRETERRIYPLENGGRTGTKAPLKLTHHQDDQPVLVVRGDDPAHIRFTLAQAAGDLKSNSNEDLREPIRLDGVREPILVFIAELVHEDGSPEIVVPMAADGSSRMAWCHEFLGLDSRDVPYKWAMSDPRAWGGLLGGYAAVQDLPAGDAVEDQLTAHRCLVAPAEVVLHVAPVRGRESVDSVAAYRSMVGAIHVAPPKGWGRSAENDETASAVLDVLREDGHVDEAEFDYLAGLMTPKEAEDAGYARYADCRAARLVAVVNSEAARASVSRAACNISQKSRLGRNDRPSIAAELAMRACRSTVGTELSARRSTLERAFLLSEWRDGSIEFSGEDPADLRDEALAGLEEKADELPPAAVELGLYGVYWLATTGTLRRETSRSWNKLGPDKVMRRIMSSPRGIHQLYQVVTEGRMGKEEFSVVTEDGDIFYTEAGDGKKVDDRYLREEFEVHQDGAGEEGGEAGGEDSDIQDDDLAPREQLRLGLRKLRGAVERVEDSVTEIKLIKDPTGVLVATEGLPRGTATNLANRLAKVTDELKYWARINQHHANTEAPGDPLDEDDVFDGGSDEDVEVDA